MTARLFSRLGCWFLREHHFHRTNQTTEIQRWHCKVNKVELNEWTCCWCGKVEKHLTSVDPNLRW